MGTEVTSGLWWVFDPADRPPTTPRIHNLPHPRRDFWKNRWPWSKVAAGAAGRRTPRAVARYRPQTHNAPVFTGEFASF